MNTRTKLVIPPWNSVLRTGEKREPVIRVGDNEYVIHRRRGFYHEDFLKNLMVGATLQQLVSCGVDKDHIHEVIYALLMGKAIIVWPLPFAHPRTRFPCAEYTPPILKKGYYPEQLILEIIGECSQDCDMCYCDRTVPPMSLRPLINAVNEAAALGVEVVVTGGECTLHPHFRMLIEGLRVRRIPVKILTCGQSLDEDTVQFLAQCHVSSVQVSLLSDTPPKHDNITQNPGSHYRVRQAIRLLEKYNVPCEVAILGMRENTVGPGRLVLDTTREIAIENGATSATISASLIPGPQKISPVDFSTLREMARDGSKTGSMVTRNTVACTAPYDMITVAARHGNTVEVHPCPTWNVPCGDFPRQSLFEIFNGPVFERLRQPVEATSACVGCTLSAHCERCPGIAYRAGNDATTCNTQAWRSARARNLEGTYPQRSRVFCELSRITPNRVVRKLSSGIAKERKHERKEA